MNRTNRVLILTAAALVLAAFALAQRPFGQSAAAADGDQVAPEKAAHERTARELNELEQLRLAAIEKKDAKFLDGLFTDDYLMIDPLGGVVDKQTNVQSLTAGAFKYDSMKASDVKVRTYGDAAVVTGVIDIRASYNGRDLSGTYRVTDVFVRQGGKWRCASTQVTRINEVGAPR